MGLFKEARDGENKIIWTGGGCREKAKERDKRMSFDDQRKD